MGRFESFLRFTVAIVLLSGSLAAYAQQSGSKPTTASTDYSKDPFIFEQYHVSVRFENDGTGAQTQTVWLRVQSEAGVSQLGQLVFPYNSASEKFEISYLRVHKADGSVVTAAPDAVKDLTSQVARDAPVYTDSREKHVAVPALQPQETIEYQVVHRIEHPVAPGQFWFEYSFISDIVVLDEKLEINLPRDRAVKLKTAPGADPHVTDSGDRRIYLWTSSHTQHDTEAEAKKKTQPAEPKPPAIQLTTFQSWDEVGRWYAALERDRLAPAPDLRAKAQELVSGKTSDLDKIAAIYDYVATKFRYVSLSFGVGRYQPHAAGEIFANQYGDCKDKHTLLAAMLATVGFTADAALIPVTRKVDPDVPSPAQFDHVISVVRLGQEMVWLDTTPEVAPFRLLLATLRDKQALVIAPDGASRLVATPPDPPFPSTQRVDVDAQVSALGKLTARVRYTLRGDNELLLRVAFRHTPQAKWDELGRLIALIDGFRGDVSEVKPSDPAATHDPFVIELQIAQSNYLDWYRNKSTVALPLPALGLPESDEESSEPLKLGTPLEISEQLKLQLAPGYTPPAPVGLIVARDYAEYRSSYKAEGSSLTAERVLRFEKRELPADRRSDYAAFLRAVRSDEGQAVTIEGATGGAPTIPKDAKADELNEAGSAAFSAGDWRAAAQMFERVVELEPKHKDAWNSLGRADLALGKYDDAATAFRKQIELHPYDQFAYNNLGLALMARQKYDEAAAAFRKQLELNPLDRNAHASLGSLYLQQHKYTDALPELEKAAALSPDNPNLQFLLGQAYMNLNQTDKAMAAFDSAVEKVPTPQTWNNVAYELAQHSLQLDRAQRYAESAIAATEAALRNVDLDHLTSTDLARTTALAAYWDTLGWIYFRRGDLERAEKFVNASWQLDQHGEVGDHLGQIDEKLGRKKDAIHLYELALASPRPVAETRGRLATLLGTRESDTKINSVVDGVRGELSQMRTIQLGKLLKENVNAEFFVLLAPGPKLDALKFISGSDALRPFAENLRAASYPVVFPDEAPTRLVRRGVLSCSSLTGQCEFVLFPAEDVRTVN